LYVPGSRIEDGRARNQFAELAERGPDGVLRFFHLDHLGSVIAVTDPSGAVVHRAAYLPFGEVRPGSEEGSFTPREGFNHHESDASGFLDYGARLYDPATGRFISPDTVLTDGPNRYTYVGNNPLGRVDPSGHAEKKVVSDDPPDLT